MTQEEILEKLTMDIRLRGLSKDIEKEYVTRSAVFMRHFGKSADEMDEKEVRIFLEYLTNKGDFMPETINNYNSALRFLFEVTLEQSLCIVECPARKTQSKCLQHLQGRKFCNCSV